MASSTVTPESAQAFVNQITSWGPTEPSPLNGNSVYAPTTAKIPNATAEAIRKVPSAGTKPAAKKPKLKKVAVVPSSSSVGQPPSIADKTAVTSRSTTPSMTPVDMASADSYRTGSRSYGEPDEEKVATIAVRMFDDSYVVQNYANFFLQSVAEAEQEKYQVVETFTAYYAFFYGRRPPIYTYSGILLNDPNNNWMNQFRYMYDNFFRGTASAEIGAEAVIEYDKRVVSGYILNLNINQDAMSDKGVPFSFSMLVITHTKTQYGENFQQFVQSLTEQLQTLKQQAAATSASLNKNADSTQTILKNMVLQGKAPTVSLKKADEKLIPKPDTSIAGQSAEKIKSLTQNKAPSNSTASSQSPILNTPE